MNSETISLLNSWKEVIDSNEYIHRIKALRYRKLYFMLGIPATIFSGLFTASSLASLTQCEKYYELCVAQAIISAITTGLVGIQTYMQMSTQYTDNKTASDRYQALSRTIETYLISSENLSPEIISNIRGIFDDIVQTSPLVATDLRLPIKKPLENKNIGLPTHDESPKNYNENPKNENPKTVLKEVIVESPKDNEIIPMKKTTSVDNGILNPMMLWQLEMFNRNKKLDQEK
jgi:hypothetical protein